jgi:hypothetical protein
VFHNWEGWFEMSSRGNRIYGDNMRETIGKVVGIASESVACEYARVRTFGSRTGLFVVLDYRECEYSRGAYDTRVGSKFLSRAIPVGLPCTHATVIFE